MICDSPGGSIDQQNDFGRCYYCTQTFLELVDLLRAERCSVALQFALEPQAHLLIAVADVTSGRCQRMPYCRTVSTARTAANAAICVPL